MSRAFHTTNNARWHGVRHYSEVSKNASDEERLIGSERHRIVEIIFLNPGISTDDLIDMRLSQCMQSRLKELFDEGYIRKELATDLFKK